MAKPIIELIRGVVPKTDRDWNDVFGKINKFLKVVGDTLQIGGEIQLPALSVGTPELKADSVTNDKLRDSAALSVVGRPSGTGGNPSDIVSTNAETFMVRRGSALTWDVLQDGDIPGSIARSADVTTEISDAIADHVGEPDPHPTYAREASTTTISGAWTFSLPPVMPTHAVAALPSAATYARGLIYVSDETGGAVLAFSDGTNWRRVTDRNVVS